jgi:hypothetical protein
MTATLEIAGSLWLMFNLFLFAALGRASCATLWNNAVDRLQRAIDRRTV